MPRPDFPRLAYLTSVYPAVSHTFIQREIEALRTMGFEVETCSIRKPASSHLTGPEERVAEARTFYVLDSVRHFTTLPMALMTALTRPGRLLSALMLGWRTAPPGAKGSLKQIAYFAEALILARHLKQRNNDHLHNHFASSSCNVTILASALSGVPYSFTLHGPSDLFEPEKWCLREKINGAAFVACISHYCRAQAMLFSDPAHWSKLRIVHCGVDPELYDRPRPTRPEEPVELLFVGRLARVKGLMVLLDALQLIAPGTAFRLTIVGDGPERALLEQAALPLGPRVRFTGYMSQQDVAEQLTRTDIFVLPSFAEGVPVVLMEAMAARVPVIATQVAGVSELVEDGQHGLLVPPGDVRTLADRIEELSADPGRRRQMGAAGREKVCAAFDMRQEAARIGALFAGRAGGSVRPDQLSAQ